jgi:hypothetical protein
MITSAVHSGNFIKYYLSNSHLHALAADSDGGVSGVLRNRDSLGKFLQELGDVAVLDASIVAGGALRYLQREHPEALQDESAADIVGRSVGLQLVAGVPDDRLQAMRKRLGFPYTARQYLTRTGTDLDFTAQARAFLHSLQQNGTGCPAHDALTHHTVPQSTFLRHAWADLAGIVLPPNATAGMRPPKTGKPKR